jgi:hypothetical protein
MFDTPMCLSLTGCFLSMDMWNDTSCWNNAWSWKDAVVIFAKEQSPPKVPFFVHYLKS